MDSQGLIPADQAQGLLTWCVPESMHTKSVTVIALELDGSSLGLLPQDR